VDESSSATASPAGRWWLTHQGKVTGPLSTAEVIAAIAEGRVSLSSAACLDGTNSWRALTEWPEFGLSAQGPTSRSTAATQHAIKQTSSSLWKPWSQWTLSSVATFFAVVVLGLRVCVKLGIDQRVAGVLAVIALVTFILTLPGTVAYFRRPILHNPPGRSSPVHEGGRPAANAWFVQVGESLWGPFTASQLQAGVISGEFFPGALVRPDSGSIWRPIHDWPELRASAGGGASL